MGEKPDHEEVERMLSRGWVLTMDGARGGSISVTLSCSAWAQGYGVDGAESIDRALTRLAAMTRGDTRGVSPMDGRFGRSQEESR